MKKFLVVLLIVLLSLAVLVACDKGDNLLDADVGGFENGVGKWTAGSDVEASEYSIMDYTEYKGLDIAESVNDGTIKGKTEYLLRKNGSKVLKLGGSVEIDASFTKELAVENYAVYMVECEVYIPVEHTTGTYGYTPSGFYCTVNELNGATPINLKQANEGFTTYRFYFKTNDFSKVNLKIGIGSSTAKSLGTTYVDNVTVTKSSTPKNTMVYSLGSDVSTTYSATTMGNVYLCITVLVGALLMAGIFVLLLRNFKRKDVAVIDDKGTLANSQVFFTQPAVVLSGVLLISFAVRLIIANFVYGYVPYITALQKAVTTLMTEKLSYFSTEGATLIEPGNLYLMWGFGALAKAFGLEAGSIGYSIFLRIPTIIADIVGVFLVFNIAYKKYNSKIAGLFALAYGLIPVFFTASTAWGDYSSIAALFLLLTFVYAADKNIIGTASCYLLSLLFSCYSLLLLPLIIVFECYIFVKQPEHRNMIAITATAAFILFYCITVPFGASYFALGKPFYMFEVYWNLFLQNTAFTLNTFNLYGMFDVNMQTANGAANGVSIAFTVLLLCYSLFLYLVRKDRLNLMLIAAFVIVAFATFTTRISVFTILPSLLLMLVYSIRRGDIRVLAVFAVFATTTLINSAYIMSVSGYFGSVANSFNMVLNGLDGVLITFSIINVLTAGFFAYVVYDICINEKIMPLCKEIDVK